MSEVSIHVGQIRVVGFFAIYCILALTGLLRASLGWGSMELSFGLLQCVFVLLAGAASWYLYRSKKAGWYISVAFVLTWFASLVVVRGAWNGFAIMVTVGMFAVLVWLLKPEVKARFEVRSSPK